MRRLIYLLAWSAAISPIAMIAQTSHAAVIHVAASGDIASGVDGAGLFGAAGADLAGEDYSVSFNIDTSKGYVTGGVVSYPEIGPRYYSSTLHDSGATPAVSGQISLDGVDYVVDGSKTSINEYQADLHTDQDDLDQDVASANAELMFYDGFYPIYPASPLDDPSEGVFHDPNLNPQSFSIDYRGDEFTVGSFSFDGPQGSTMLSLNTDLVNYDVISAGGGPTAFASAAPEPSTWALMTAAIGVVGATLRLRGRRTSFQSA